MVKRVALAVVLVIGLVITVESPPAGACSCAGSRPGGELEAAWTALDRSDGAFVGSLLSRGAPAPDERGVVNSGQLVSYVFQVDQDLKGGVGTEITVLSASDGAACGFEAPVGRPIGVVVYRRGGAWQGNLCGQYPAELLRQAAGLPPSLAVKRLGGPDRYDTARAIALDAPAPRAPEGARAVLASGEASPDALAATAAAVVGAAPVLLTTRGQLPAATLAALQQTGTRTVTVVGGPGAVAEPVVAELGAAGYRTERVAGVDRYGTAAAIARATSPYSVGTLEGMRTAVLVSGVRPHDGLAAGPLAYAGRFPLLLTAPDVLPADTRQALTELAITQVLLVGGQAAVHADVEARLRALGLSVRRVAGTTRTETALALADIAVGVLGRSTVGVAGGGSFADALAAGAHAGRVGAPLLLTLSAAEVGWQVENWLRDRAGRVEGVVVYGGTAAVSEAAVSQVTVAATP